MRIIKFLLLTGLYLNGFISEGQVLIIPAVDTSLYIGVDNRIEIRSSKISATQLRLRTSNGLVSGRNGNYVIRCAYKTSDALLEVTYKNKVLARKKLSVNVISDPVVYVIGDSLFGGGEISKKQVLSFKNMIVKCNYPLANFQVVSFIVEIIHNQKSKGTVDNRSNSLVPETKFYLEHIEKGDELIFDDIRVVSPDSRSRTLPSIRFKII